MTETNQRHNLDEATQARLFREWKQILLMDAWTPVQRITAQMLLLQAEPKQEFGYRVIESCSAERVAGWLGVSDKTARETMMTLKDAGVIERDVRGFAVNRMGQEIPSRAMDTRRGDRFQKDTTVSMPLALPDELPALGKGNNVKRTRVTNAKRVAEFRHIKTELQKMLDNAQCPHCAATGTLRVHVGATCLECGTVLDEGEVQALAETEIISVSECPPNFTPEPDPALALANQRRAMRNLKGRATSPGMMAAHGSYDEGSLMIELEIPQTEIISATVTPPNGNHFRLGGGETVNSSAQSVETEIFTVSEETLRGGKGGAIAPASLTGAATLEYLASHGAAFCLTDGKDGRKPCDDLGVPLAGNYLDMPQALPVAVANLTRGGGAGLLPEHSAGLTLLDIDAGLDSLLKMWPGLAHAPRVFRENAPDRAKLVILVSDPGPKMQRQDAKQPTCKAELLGRGHGNVAGLHPSGEPYQLTTGEVMTFTRAQVEAMLAQWIPNAYTGDDDKRATHAPPLSASSANSAQAVQVCGDQVKAAIAWWNANPVNQQQVDVLLAGCKHAGKYVSVRPNDGTPSTRRTDTRDNYSRRTWRDYGQQRTYDDYELYVTLNGFDKGSHKWQVVQEWREANGKKPLNLTH